MKLNRKYLVSLNFKIENINCPDYPTHYPHGICPTFVITVRVFSHALLFIVMYIQIFLGKYGIENYKDGRACTLLFFCEAKVKNGKKKDGMGKSNFLCL